MLRFWREGLIGALVIGLLVQALIYSGNIAECEARRNEVQAALDRTKSDYRTAQAQAQADNLSKVREIERANAAKTQEIQSDLETQLADARVAGAGYAERLRLAREAVARAAHAAGMPAKGDPASVAADASGEADLAENIRICSENTVKADGWQRWWESVK